MFTAGESENIKITVSYENLEILDENSEISKNLPLWSALQKKLNGISLKFNKPGYIILCLTPVANLKQFSSNLRNV